MDDCLVYFFTGFLDSGKTTAICSWASNEQLASMKSIIISTEEGEVEYDESLFLGVKPMIVHVETTDIDSSLLFSLEEKYKPELIFIEWNGSVSPADFFDKIDVPDRWLLAAAVAIVDASTYSNYYKNMQTMFADYYRYCDTVIFNRVDAEKDNLPKLRGSVKSINPATNINFMGINGEMLDIADHLPYDLNANPCVIAADDFGLFYTDALDNVERYGGKRVSLIGQAIEMRETRGRAFVLQRNAYTCCADDIGVIGVLCFYNYKSGFPAGAWLKVTGTVAFFNDKRPDGKQIAVPTIKVDDYAVTSKPDNETIYFS